MMDFYEVLDQVIDLLKQRGRVSYRALKVQFKLDDDYIGALQDELIKAQRLAVDEDGSVLVWRGEAGGKPEPTSQPDQTTQPDTQVIQPTQVESPPTEPHTPNAERRQLTVMFCDLVESTALSGQMDAEDYRELVRAYQTTCSDVIERFDCHIAQTLGDGLLIYSGYPVAHENDAERAVRVGLGILDAMTILNERLEQEKGIPLAVRVGIHTGPVVVGEVGTGTRQEQLALGETPNVAARIQGIAQPDTVVISADTYRLIQGYFDCETIGERELRGVTEPIVIYRVLHESGAQSRLDIASVRGLTPLVGREQEVGLLLERWEQSKDGHGQVVLLSGEAGIGKSRLVQALKDHLAEEPHTRLECRSSSYFTNSALYPIIDMIQRTLRFQTDDTPEQKLEKLVKNLSQYRLPLDESVPLFSALLSLPVPEDRYPSLNLSPQQQRQKTLESLVTIILELAEQQPVLFILEDLHWTDPTTLELLELLIDQTPTASLYALLTCRPEYQPTWSHRSYLTEVTVSRLLQSQIARMAEQVAGGKSLPAEVVQQLVDKTDGVPLYVEEMTKAVLESGVLKETNGHYELIGSVASLAIPATLQDSLMARLDRLVTAKAVAQYASVIGRQFSYELLQAVSELDESMLQHELGRLVEAELVYQRGLPPHATYTFKHALIQDTAYESLLRSTRQGYHRRIAEVLEERFDETVENQPELLAHHYMEAGLNEHAIAYWQRAGEKAVHRSAHVEASVQLTKGLELLKALSPSPELHHQELTLQLTSALAFHAIEGQASDNVERNYLRARELCELLDDGQQLFHVLIGLWRCYGGRGQHQKSRESVDELFRLAQRLEDPMMLLEAHMARGAIVSHEGELVVARNHLEQAIQLYDPKDHHIYVARSSIDPGVNSYSRLSWALWILGYPGQALDAGRKSLALARQLSHVNSLGLACDFTAILYQLCGQHEDVHEQVETAMRVSTEHDLGQWKMMATIMRGWYLVHVGQVREGIALMQQGLTAYRTSGTALYQEWLLALLAEAFGNAGQSESGLATVAEAIRLVRSGTWPWWEPEMCRLKGELLLQQSADNQTEAESCFHQSISIAQNQSAKSWELRASTSLARLWQRQGKVSEAYDLLAPVYGWFTEGFDTADLIEAKALLNELS